MTSPTSPEFAGPVGMSTFVLPTIGMLTLSACTTAPALLQAVTPLVSWMACRNRCISLRFHAASGCVRSTGVLGCEPSIVVSLNVGPLRWVRSYEM